MKVTLINHTQDAETLLLFTKSTRLNLTSDLLEEIRGWPAEKKMAELAYMANTIPSSWEFVDYTFAITGVSRAFTHQFVRNRHGSYAQQSMRVVDAGDFDFVWPARFLADDEMPMEEVAKRMRPQGVIQDTIALISESYKRLRAYGVATEDARSILPTNIATNIVAKFNLRTMSELAKSRTGGRTQGEYIAVMNAMCDAVIEVHPWAEAFLFPKTRDLFAEIEAFAEREYAGDLLKKGELLKIVDQMRKGR
jgi:flavin-dependent thymidylate synthase